ncbi:MAG TPA: hypothetical protein PLF26_21430 [Blastocatellia bacterium]|nr:hypothetical protein [Blastocatellia bacterium]
MPKNLGTFICGTNPDTVHVCDVLVTDDNGVGWGTAVGLGYTPYLEVRVLGATTLTATLTGSWVDSAQTIARFDINAATSLKPTPTVPATPDQYIDYEAVIVLDNGAGGLGRVAADNDGAKFQFRVQAYP